jgi:hypothetical protein
MSFEFPTPLPPTGILLGWVGDNSKLKTKNSKLKR